MIDLRLPVGIFFMLVGAILSGYGYLYPMLVQGYNVNLDWGLPIFIFGALMTVFGIVAQRRPPDPGPKSADLPSAKP
ncbi:MAG: hypothetical protein HKL95_12030 [Phycisphaerae bacterium]|nr:hypothetical protein [Phycisphaerae bacterium]